MLDYIKNLTWQNLGLISFVLTAIGMHVVLLYDYYLYRTNQEMITTYCRANPWAAWGILLIIQFGVLGLAVHFMAIVKVDLK